MIVPEASRNWTRNRTVNAREDDRPRRPCPGRSSGVTAGRPPSASWSRYRGRLRGLFAWPLPARVAASERVCGHDESSCRARSRHVRVGEPPNRPRRHGRHQRLPRRRAGQLSGFSRGAGEAKGQFGSRMLFVLCSSVTGGLGVCLAHIGALLRVAVVAPSGEVVNVRLRVDPNDGIRGAASARLRIGRELSGSGSADVRRGGEWRGRRCGGLLISRGGSRSGGGRWKALLSPRQGATQAFLVCPQCLCRRPCSQHNPRCTRRRFSACRRAKNPRARRRSPQAASE